jgi:hypothetical protein
MTPIQEAIEIAQSRVNYLESIKRTEYGDGAYGAWDVILSDLKYFLSKEKKIIESAYDSGVDHVIYKNNLPVEGTNVTVSGEDYYKSKFGQ